MAGILEGKTAVVTGGGKGIGREIARCLGEEGARVAVASRTYADVFEVAREISELGVDAMGVKADISDEEEVNQLIRQTVQRWGRIDVLVNNAATKNKGLVKDLARGLWDEVMATNLTGPFLCCRAALPYMIKQNWGRIINISSSYGKMPVIGNSAYNASKMGLIGFTRCLALETAGHNITANSICPGATETENFRNYILQQSSKEGLSVEDFENTFKEQSPQNRFIDPREIGRLIVYLASDDAMSITGEDININGGMIMY